MAAALSVLLAAGCATLVLAPADGPLEPLAEIPPPAAADRVPLAAGACLGLGFVFALALPFAAGSAALAAAFSSASASSLSFTSSL